MELDTFYKEFLVPYCHDFVVLFGFSTYDKFTGQGFSVYHQRVIPRCCERVVKSGEYGIAVMMNQRRFAVVDLLRFDYSGAKGITDRLVAETYAKQGINTCILFYNVHGDACLGRC